MYALHQTPGGPGVWCSSTKYSGHQFGVRASVTPISELSASAFDLVASVRMTDYPMIVLNEGRHRTSVL